jgi:small subunit ribosomal protein S9
MPRGVKKTETTVFYGTGRRKSSIARVRVLAGKGNIKINEKTLDEYMPTEILKTIIRQPLALLNSVDKYDLVVKVIGGGLSSQAGAIRHGLSRALVKANEENRAVLKPAGFLTRDPRMKERKKPGLKKARKAPQFSKR